MKTQLEQRLRAARAAINPEITQRQIAKEMSVTPSAVNLWEAGKTKPSATDLAKLSARYSVSTDWLLGVDVSNLPVRKANSTHQLNTVPIVPPAALVRWEWVIPEGLMQTDQAYPPGTAVSMRVTSDSLASICPQGSWIIVSKGHSPEPGCVVVAVVGNSQEPIVRRYMREGDTDLLMADDSRYPTFNVEDQVRVVGRVTEVVHRRVLV